MSTVELAQPTRPMIARLPFYYGWVILVVAALAMTATLPGRTHGVGLITKPLLEDLGINEVSFGVLNFWSVLIGAVFCWPIGRLIDRFGTRTVLTLVSAGLGTVVILTGYVSGPVTLFVALTLTRGLGQGALSVLSTTLVGKWFTRRVGLAMGVFAVLLAIGFIGSILAMQIAVKQEGWRTAWAAMGWMLLLGLAPLAWLMTRSTPESCGVGMENDHLKTDAERPERHADLPFRAALVSPAFWVFSFASCLYGFAWSAITLFNEHILASRGFDQDDFYLVMMILTGVGLVANLLGGWLATQWPLGRLLGLAMALLAASLLVFPFVTTKSQLVGYAITFGVASGLITVVHFAFHPKAFGRANLGQIQGFYQVLSVFTSALGPLVLAYSKDWTGSYEAMFFAIGPLAFLVGIAAVWVPLPVRPLLPVTTEVALAPEIAATRSPV